VELPEQFAHRTVSVSHQGAALQIKVKVSMLGILALQDFMISFRIKLEST
jgi:hypothetical protein